MFDQFVQQISPRTEIGTERRRFSEYLASPNIVLLGDPGSGKSHLFRETSKALSVPFLTTRQFLNTPFNAAEPTLFIDALDEKRAGRGDNDTIDSMVQKLFASEARQIRISCRAQDWLGETDLAAFKPYFDQRGGAVVLALDALTRDEMCAILAEHGVTDPAGFLGEAERRELDEFLVNPQNLIMLAEVVGGGNWPESRRELYDAATRLLLEEHNLSRSRTEVGVYTAAELRDAAGAICAIQLIADVEGISLRESDDRPDFPSYRTIGFPDLDKVRAASMRRLFRAGNAEETIDYSHRTTAEYLAAAWLAKIIRLGFSIERVRALIGVDGYPASELRGLHAWLPILLPEYAGPFIDADPFGVLTYGDAATLEPSGRKHLLEALARLAEVDPWFRANSWSTRGLGALASCEMAEPFREILRLEPPNFGLRSIVFDALANGQPLQELESDLIAVLADEKHPYSERADALQALLKFGSPARNTVAQCYPGIGRSGNEIRLRTHILSALYGDKFGPGDAADLITDALNSDNDLATGSLWSLSESIPLADLPDVLDRLDPSLARLRTEQNWRNVSEVCYTFDRILLRVLKEFSGIIPVKKLKIWLRFRMLMHRYDSLGLTDEIRDQLKGKKEEQRELVRDLLAGLEIDEHRLNHLHEFHEMMLGVVDGDDELDWYCDCLDDVTGEPAREAFVYEIALRNSYRATPRALERFEWLWRAAEQRPQLIAIRDSLVFAPISDTLAAHWERIARRAGERTEQRLTNRQEFERQQAEIRTGAPLGWLAWLANIYFFSGAENCTPRGRLAVELGGANAEIAIEGFRALLQHDDFPRLKEQIELRAQNQHTEFHMLSRPASMKNGASGLI